MTSFIRILLTNVLDTIQKKLKLINSSYEKIYPNLRIYLLEPKLQIREYIINNSKKVLHFKLLMSSVPVLVGISQIIYLKYQDQTFSYFFKKNLPGISSEQAKISWQTFEQVFSDQLKFDSLLATSHLSNKNEILKNTTFNQHHKFIRKPISQTVLPSFSVVQSSEQQPKELKNSFILLNDLYIKRVDFYSDSILIKTSSHLNAKKNQFFIGTFPNSKYLNNFSTRSVALQGKEFGRISTQVGKFQNKTQFGNNWYKISAKDIFTCSTSIKNTSLQSSLKNISTWGEVKPHPNFFKKNTENSRYLRCFATQKAPQRELNFFKNNQNYFYQFYLHLDELPVKLEESSTDKIQQGKNFIVTNKKIYQIKQNRENRQNSNQNAFFKKEIQSSFNTLRRFSFSRLEKMRIANKMNGKVYFSQSPFSFISHKINKISNSSLYLPNKNSIHFFKAVKNLNLNNVSLLEEVFSTQETNKVLSNFSTELNFKNENNFLQDEIKKNFYEKNLRPILNLSSLDTKILNGREVDELISVRQPEHESVLGFGKTSPQVEKEIVSWISDETNSIKLLEFISELETSTSPQSAEFIKPEHFMFLKTDVVSPRFMSGYRFPDMSNKSNLSALIQFFYKKNSNLFSIISSNFYERNYNPILKIDLSKNFSYSFEFLNSKLNLPKSPFSFESEITYKNFKHPETIVYQGPAIFQDKIINERNINSSEKVIKQKNLDETSTTGSLQLTQWVKQFLDADNPLSDRREIFFGKNVFDELTNLQKKPIDPLLFNAKDLVEVNPKWEHETDFLIKVPLIKKSVSSPKTFEAPLVLNELVVAELTDQEIQEKPLLKEEILNYSPVISSHIESYVVYLRESEWETFYKKIAAKEPTLPIIEIYSPKQGFIEWPLNQLDYQGAEHFISSQDGTFLNLPLQRKATGKNENCFDKKQFSNILKYDFLALNKTRTNTVTPNYHYLPYSQTLTKKILPKKYFFGKVSKKKFSIYENTEKTNAGQNNKFSKLFLEVFEPISSNSWLFVTQFSIGLLLFQILQTILQKYEKEMKYVFSSLLENRTENSTNLDLGLDEQDEKFRLIKNVKKRFHDIAGIDTILPELGEIVWFLRNSGRSFKVGNTIPKGILLTGPPGTGKTLLVQAIAGEAEVPVLIESGSSLKQPYTSETGAERLKSIFQKAREMSPCILFIDEIDTLGETRDEILENPITTNEIINCIYPSLKNTKKNLLNSDNLFLVPQSRIFIKDESIESSQAEFLSDAQTNKSSDSSGQLFNRINKKQQNQNLSKQQKSNLLLQFLIELDGIANQKKILVIGATNRPQILDAALTRPGRFDKVLELKLPGKQKRIEILKLYSKNLGVDKTIYWDYLANLTMGLSAADLASVMNQSSMKAIESETIHTIQTIEYGINSISGYIVSSPHVAKEKTTQNVTEKINKRKQLISDTGAVFATRLAYYQAGKAIIHTLLKHHPPVIVLHLWPQLKTPRYHLVNSIIEKEFSQIHTRIQLESRIIGFYAGKAAELLGLFHAETNFSLNNSPNKKNKQVNTAHTFLSFWQSDLGIEDISFASWLIQLMINKWYFYSKKISTQKLNQLYENSNLEQISDFGVFEFFKQLSFEMETRANHGLQTNQSPSAHETTFGFENSQNWITTPWLQTQIIKKLEFSYLKNNHWYKIYVGDHEENENTRCVSPDDYYHNNVSLNNLVQNKLEPPEKKLATCSETDQSFSQHNFIFKTPFQDFSNSFTWNNLLNSNRDYIYHGLTLNCFNKAISILDENRELLDYFASYLVQKEIIREHEILEIINKFSFKTTKKNSKETIKIINQQKILIKNFSEISNVNQTRKIIEKSWGKYSRKKLCRFINFQTIQNN